MKSDLVKAKAKNRTVGDLQRLQELPLIQKINLSKRRISEFYTLNNGNVYVSFSGGKDSTVLLHLVRSLYPDVEAVFVDTGLEFDSIRQFVKTNENVAWLKPKKKFTQVLEEHGYPVVSKETSQYVRDLQNPTKNNEHTRRIRLEGSEFKGGKKTTGRLPKKWHFLADAPFKCSSMCCNIMKKMPAKNFTKQTGKFPYIGTMTEESSLRRQSWLKNGCNMFTGGNPQSNPLAFWTENNIWEYIKTYNLPYADVYDKGAKRTGCVFCLFGYWSNNDHNTSGDRMEMLKRIEPKKYDYCMKSKEDGGLGLKAIIDYIDKGLQKDGDR